jgi:hypothetical protein
VAGNPLLGQRPRGVYQDPRLPILYGCPSGRAGLLGSERAQVTGRERDSLPGDATAYLDFILGFGNAVAELRRQKALLRHGDQPTAPDLLHNGGFKPSGWNDYMLVALDQSRGERWEPGMMRIQDQDLRGAGSIAPPGFWMTYRLLGSAAGGGKSSTTTTSSATPSVSSAPAATAAWCGRRARMRPTRPSRWTRPARPPPRRSRASRPPPRRRAMTAGPAPTTAATADEAWAAACRTFARAASPGLWDDAAQRTPLWRGVGTARNAGTVALLSAPVELR